MLVRVALARGRGRDRDEAPEARAADHRHHRPVDVSRDPAEPLPDRSREVLLQLVRLLAQARGGLGRLDAEIGALERPEIAGFQLPRLRREVLNLEKRDQMRIHRAFSSRSCRNSSALWIDESRPGTSGSFANCAIFPSTGRYWFETSRGGATMRKKCSAGLPSKAWEAIPVGLRP